VGKIKSKRYALLHTRKMELSDLYQPMFRLNYKDSNQIGNLGCKYLSRANIKNLEYINLGI
jgi:hypothetical protein